MCGLSLIYWTVVCVIDRRANRLCISPDAYRGLNIVLSDSWINGTRREIGVR